MLAQSNLATEAHNLIHFQMNFASNPSVIFPTVIRATPEVLIEVFSF
jgi:predicted unusual protein kinase regulating ubiquinone biosynthesis (AarF/ABC1/UbiB family)